MTLRIGNAAGFLGDQLDAPRQLVQQGQLDYLTLEYLAELTMAILARARQKDPRAGYARDFIRVLGNLVPSLYLEPTPRIVTNAGGVNPRGCAAAAAGQLAQRGCGDVQIGVVTGDDLVDRLEELHRDGCPLANLDNGQPFSETRAPVVCANAYLGARPIVEALAGGARIVITGRVADASLTVGPVVHQFGWEWDDWDRLAAASVAGHLIECGAQVTGGYRHEWRDINLENVGYPIAEVDDTRVVITKPPGSGGIVNRTTVVEQLVYETGDPAHYLTPDVDVDMTGITLHDESKDRVEVRGARGRPAPAHFKVSLTYQAGFMASGQLVVYGRDCVERARGVAEIVRQRLARAKAACEEFHVELLGAGEGVPGMHEPPDDLREVVLRIAVRDRRQESVERFVEQFAPLITSGPAGLAGYATGRSPVRPALAYWPTLVPRELIEPHVDVRPASEWPD
ncbi:MAG: acyclic terpene utilization AtuA family protein [Pirellulales bacterium]